MSLLDNVKQMVSGQAAESGEEAGLLGHVMDMVNNPATGGLQGFIQQFHDKGLGGVVSSWIGNEENQAISAQQIEQVVGQERINAIASRLGIPPEEASAKLAQFLPSIIDRLTPGGKVEQA
ncbi:MAG TPA: YidB family protein [Pseudacidobacterium sp.]|nr:YidB family protein [Pseudacidobacterium sp.]